MANSRKKLTKYQRDLNRTQSTHTDDPVVNRAEQVRRDDDVVKTPAVDFHQIDHAIKWHIENKVKPLVLEADELIKVPVMYASPEKWSSVQRQGFFRDSKGKIMIPLIMYRRTDSAKRTEIPRNKIVDDTNNKVMFKKKYNNQNRYDQFSILTAQKPVEEFYSMNVPDYITVSYELVIWCDYTSQVNKLTEDIIAHENTAWGETYKFTTSLDSFTFETVNTTGEDRIVKATTTLKTQGYLIPTEVNFEPNMTKHYGKAKLKFGCEVVSDINAVKNFKK